MCGICGISTYQSRIQIREPIIRNMIDALKHRGPNESGIYISVNVGLGVARLKVIDLETGSQPIFNEDKSIVVICNGEIVNFVELRKELETEGHHFYTNSDTEVIAHLYESHGTDCLKFLSGMFAFALWDNKNKLLMLARDRLGIKPLYYFYDENNLEFASELRALLVDKTLDKAMDMEALYDYLALMFIPVPRTIFKKIKKLESGHCLLWKNGILNDYTYWRLEDFHFQDLGEKHYIEKLDGLLKNTTKMWLRSNVPLGLFLSGGIDSTLLANYITREVKGFNTFTAIFGQKGYDENLFAQKTAINLETNHHEISINQVSPEVIYR